MRFLVQFKAQSVQQTQPAGILFIGQNEPTQNVIFLKKPFPVEKPDVFNKDFYLSDKGKAFEEEIADFLENIIKDEFAIWPINFSE